MYTFIRVHVHTCSESLSLRKVFKKKRKKMAPSASHALRRIFIFIGTRIALSRDRHPHPYPLRYPLLSATSSFWIGDLDSYGSSSSRRKCPSSADTCLATSCIRRTRNGVSRIRCSECICEPKIEIWHRKLELVVPLFIFLKIILWFYQNTFSYAKFNFSFLTRFLSNEILE